MKVTDFGLSKFLEDEGTSLMTSHVGTAPFMAPEFWRRDDQGKVSYRSGKKASTLSRSDNRPSTPSFRSCSSCRMPSPCGRSELPPNLHPVLPKCLQIFQAICGHLRDGPGVPVPAAVQGRTQPEADRGGRQRHRHRGGAGHRCDHFPIGSSIGTFNDKRVVC